MSNRSNPEGLIYDIEDQYEFKIKDLCVISFSFEDIEYFKQQIILAHLLKLYLPYIRSMSLWNSSAIFFL
jgi:hypothetical protein